MTLCRLFYGFFWKGTLVDVIFGLLFESFIFRFTWETSDLSRTRLLSWTDEDPGRRLRFWFQWTNCPPQFYVTESTAPDMYTLFTWNIFHTFFYTFFSYVYLERCEEMPGEVPRKVDSKEFVFFLLPPRSFLMSSLQGRNKNSFRPTQMLDFFNFFLFVGNENPRVRGIVPDNFR